MYINHETLEWAKKQFSSVHLYNKTREARLIQIGSKLAEGKGTSLARLFDNWHDTKATYTLLRQPVMTPDTIQETHRKLAYNDIVNWPGDILAIEDASEFEWNGKEPIEGLGPIGSGREQDQGFILHSTLAIGICENNSSAMVLGLPFQQFYIRPPTRTKRKKRSNTNDPIETDLWRKVIRKKAIPSLKNVIRICDRASDIYENIQESKAYGCRHIFRLKHDRIVTQPKEILIKTLLKDLEPIGQTKIEKRLKTGSKKEIVTLNLNWQKVSLRAPSRPGTGIGKLPPLEETVVHAWGYLESGELIEWFLYTDLEVGSIDDAIKIIKYYAKRWVIEDYHKTLKTGMRAEHLQLETAHALFAAIAIMSVVALRLVDLRERLRIHPDAPANESGFNELELKVLGRYLNRELKTVKCVVLAIGRLGGHQNRKSDGMPGVLSLWWGLSRF